VDRIRVIYEGPRGSGCVRDPLKTRWSGVTEATDRRSKPLWPRIFARPGLGREGALYSRGASARENIRGPEVAGCSACALVSVGVGGRGSGPRRSIRLASSRENRARHNHGPGRTAGGGTPAR
jgi:hypothetical protein